MTLIARLKTIPYLPLIAGLMVLRLIAAGTAGLVPDESYYWLWAQHPAAGYYDHPPMVAWWITVFTALSDAALFVRLPFVLSFVALCWVMYDAAKTLFGDMVARRTLLWLNTSVLLSVGSVIATPDPPSVLMWACGLWALVKLQASNKGYWWLVFGLFAGLGVEAKYTNLFLGVGVLLWFALDKSARRWLLTPWPWLGGVLAIAAMAPNLIWNAQHGWLTFAKQFGRIEAGQLTAKYLIEFVLSQPLLLNPFIFVFVVLGVLAWWKMRDDSRLSLLVALPLPLLAYLLIHVFHDRIQGNWPAPIYPCLILLAAYAADGDRLRWVRNWAAPFGITLSVIGLLYLSLSPIGPQMPGAAGLSQGWPSLAQQIATRQKQSGAGWIATTDYNTEGELSYHMPVPVIGMAERERYNWPVSAAASTRALIVTSANQTPDLAQCFTDLRDLGTVSRLKKPDKKSDFQLHTGLLKSADCEID